VLLRAEPLHPGGEYGAAVAVGDFDGDGRDDLAVGEPGMALLGVLQQGQVTVYLSRPGRTFTALTSWSSVVEDDIVLTGAALVAGDFDGVPPDELAVGMPDHAEGGHTRAGAVAILSFADGVATRLIEMSDLDAGRPQTSGSFGRRLAVGDFNADGYDDLVVGMPFWPDKYGVRSGEVTVIRGSASGLDVDAVIGLSLLQLASEPDADGDQFGEALAVGDFDGDGFDDLAIGAPGRSVAGHPDAGEVWAVHGASFGIDVEHDTRQRFDDASIGLTVEDGDRFGAALAAGDFNGPGAASCVFLDSCADDLAIGAPGEDIGLVADAGNAAVLFGVRGAGLTTASPQLLDQSSFGYLVEADDQFGFTLAAGALDSTLGSSPATAADDLIVGVPLEDVGSLSNAGVAHLVFGSFLLGGLSSTSSQLQEAFAGYGVGPPAALDRFGEHVAIGDFDGDGRGDVAMGMLFYDGMRGAVQVLFGGLCSDGFERGDTSAWRQSP